MKIEIYGGDWCKPCQRTKQLALDSGNETIFKDVSADAEAHEEAEQRLGRKLSSIPVVFVDGEYIGGEQALKDLLIK